MNEIVDYAVINWNTDVDSNEFASLFKKFIDKGFQPTGPITSYRKGFIFKKVWLSQAMVKYKDTK